MLPELLAALDAFDDVRVVTDPEPAALPGTWRTHRACLESIGANGTHLLVLQDDAMPVHSFMPKVNNALVGKPNDLLALFAPGFGFIHRRMVEAQRNGQNFTLLPHTAFVPLVAIVYPVALLERLLGWADGDSWPAASKRTLRGSDDGIVAMFARSARVHVWATVPCLADHRVDVASIAKPAHHVGAHRRAALL